MEKIMKKVKVYGIKNCDTVKKALTHLADNKYEVDFIDYKKTLPTVTNINNWFEVLKDYPVNKKGTTYRKVGPDFEVIKNHDKKIQFIIENSSMIIRPIVEDSKTGKVLAIGKEFSEL